MVNVGAKPLQRRRAVAIGKLVCQPATIRALQRKALPKGDVLTVAQIAGIQAAKRTAELIRSAISSIRSAAVLRLRAIASSISWACAAARNRSSVPSAISLTG